MNIEEIAAELRAQRDRIDQAINALSANDTRRKKGSRKLSDEGRRRISEAMKLRWANRKKHLS